MFYQRYSLVSYVDSYEMLNGQTPNRKSDIWSLGCVTYELMKFNLPYLGQNLDEIRSAIKQDYLERNALEDVSSRYSKRLNYLCRAMLCINETMRPSLE